MSETWHISRITSRGIHVLLGLNLADSDATLGSAIPPIAIHYRSTATVSVAVPHATMGTAKLFNREANLNAN